MGSPTKLLLWFKLDILKDEALLQLNIKKKKKKFVTLFTPFPFIHTHDEKKKSTTYIKSTLSTVRPWNPIFKSTRLEDEDLKNASRSAQSHHFPVSFFVLSSCWFTRSTKSSRRKKNIKILTSVNCVAYNVWMGIYSSLLRIFLILRYS